MCVASLWLATTAWPSRAQDATDRAPAAPSASSAQWREAPAYVALFVPRIYRQAYRAFVSPLDLDAALRTVLSDPEVHQAPGSWTPRSEGPLDAFGAGGTYDKWKISRLYGATQARVARGPRGQGPVVEESWTLISPYPSADLEKLETGTLLLILRIP